MKKTLGYILNSLPEIHQFIVQMGDACYRTVSHCEGDGKLILTLPGKSVLSVSLATETTIDFATNAMRISYNGKVLELFPLVVANLSHELLYR